MNPDLKLDSLIGLALNNVSHFIITLFSNKIKLYCREITSYLLDKMKEVS